MNKQEYKEYIGKFNGQCKCLALQELFEARRKTGALEKTCIFFKGNANLESPKAGDEQFLADYRKKAQELALAYEQYRTILEENIGLNAVNLTLHDVEREIPIKQIQLSELEKYISHDNHVITCFCSLCRQQIDVLT